MWAGLNRTGSCGPALPIADFPLLRGGSERGSEDQPIMDVGSVSHQTELIQQGNLVPADFAKRRAKDSRGNFDPFRS